jgi:NAD(P)-dependent dehydrogenase (short-subunit alcohol dehydrogenase family)
MFVSVDVTNEEDVKNLYAVTQNSYGSVDITFNNAGISPPDDGSILSTCLDAWRKGPGSQSDVRVLLL